MNKEFLKLVAENPDLPIFGFVDSDVVLREQVHDER